MKRLLPLLLVFFALSAAAQVYVVGTFNGWNPKAPLSLTHNTDGTYSATIDFGDDPSFKMSTTCDPNASGNGWAEFDAGCIAFKTTPSTGVWTPITVGESKANQKAPTTGTQKLTVDLINLQAMFGESSGPATPWSGELALLVINTENAAPVNSKETYVTATCYIDPTGSDSPAMGSREEPVALQIKGRGNYTWTGFDKKPYRLKFVEKQSPMGLTKNKHFALLANADDNLGMSRNLAGFTASKAIGMPWTPATVPVEVVLNGDYIGLYFLTETIRVDKTRVNVVEQQDLATTDVDGGWLVEIDNYDTDPHVTVYENGNSSLPIWFTYKSPEELSSEQHDYLLTQMQAVDDAIYKNGTNADALAALVDLDILARYYIVQEVMDDTESFHGSCYLNRQRGDAQKWKFGPVWDFGNAFNRGDSKQFIYQNPAFHQVWIGAIAKFPAFQDAIQHAWYNFLQNGPETLTTTLNDYATRCAAAARCDAKRWPKYGTNDLPGRVARMQSYLSDRIAWLKTQWGFGAVDDIAGAPAEGGETCWFTIQGLEIAAPTAPGLYIRRQGSQASKLLIR